MILGSGSPILGPGDIDEIVGPNVPEIGGGGIGALPSNAIADGDFEKVGVADWQAWSGATITKESGQRPGGLGQQVLRVAQGETGPFAARQAALEIGKSYQFQGWARGDGTDSPKLYHGGVSKWGGTSSTTWQSFVVEFVATDTTFYLYCSGSQVDSWIEWDDLAAFVRG